MLQIPKYQGGVHLVIKKLKFSFFFYFFLPNFFPFSIVPIKNYFPFFPLISYLFFLFLFLNRVLFRFKIQMFSVPEYFFFLFFVTR